MRRAVVMRGVIAGAALLCLAAAAPAAEPLPLGIGGEFTLIDQRGASRDSGEFRGGPVLVYFGYTECPHSCGMALNTVSAALDILGEDAAGVAALFVSVDPVHDDPARLARHLANFHPAIVGLTGSEARIEGVLADFRVAAEAVADPGAFDRLVDHTTYLYLLGPGGELMSILPPVVPPDRLAAIVRGYL